MKGQSASRTQPVAGTAAWWGRLLAALVFAFHVNYVPMHLASEAHLEAFFAMGASDAILHDEDLHHHGENHQHGPHPASDHVLRFMSAGKAPVPAGAMTFLPAPAQYFMHEPRPTCRVPVPERLCPPEESPPGPRQPRAPPLS